MQIRIAMETDIPSINGLLYEEANTHYQKRPDLFKGNGKPYTDEELKELITDTNRPVFVAEEAGEILGYAFCGFQKYPNDPFYTNVKTMRIDHICVAPRFRRRKIGTALFDFVVSFAKTLGCYNVTLNAWACNQTAMKFFEACGLRLQKVGLEKLL